MCYQLLELEMPASSDIRARVLVDDNSPWFSGHFPDQPILPGIAHLKMVADVIARARQERLWIKHLHRVKFKRIVSPGETLDIDVKATGTSGQYSFHITHETQDVCSGMMFLDDEQHEKTTYDQQP